MENFYNELGVSPTATPEEIERAYRALVKQVHPDRNPGWEEAAADRFKRVQNAYTILSNPTLRAEYDTKFKAAFFELVPVPEQAENLDLGQRKNVHRKQRSSKTLLPWLITAAGFVVVAVVLLLMNENGNEDKTNKIVEQLPRTSAPVVEPVSSPIAANHSDRPKASNPLQNEVSQPVSPISASLSPPAQSSLAQAPPDENRDSSSDVKKPEPIETRLPIPEQTAQNEKLKLINELYKSESAVTAAEKITLATQLLNIGKETNDDPIGRFVLLLRASDVATQAGNWEIAFDADDQLGEQYVVDPLDMKCKVLAAINENPKSDVQSLMKGIELALDQAVSNGRYEIASQFAGQAELNIRKRLSDTADKKDQREMADAYGLAASAFSVLKTNPQDAKANSVLGSFYCFVRSDPEIGLPMLQQGADETIKIISGKDLDRPQSADEQVSLADDWWGLSDKEEGLTQRGMRKRAADWYRKALPNLAGLSKAKAQNRISIAESESETRSETPKPLLLSAVALERAAKRTKTAKDALLLYHGFIDDTKVPAEEKKVAQQRLAYWDDAASKGLIRLGTDWVSIDEAHKRQRDARNMVQQAIGVLGMNVELSLKNLKEAHDKNPDDIESEFFLGVLQGGVTGDLQSSKTYFRVCAANCPNDIGMLNNLAVSEAITGEHPQAIRHFHEAIGLGPAPPEISHNLRRIIVQGGLKNLTIASSTLGTYRDLLAHIDSKADATISDSVGWLYMLPPSPPDSEQALDLSVMQNVGSLIVEGASSPKWIDNRICLLCRGKGNLVCPDCHGSGMKPSTSENPLYRDPGTGVSISTVKKTRVTCPTCNGTGRVSCQVCGGTGKEGS